MKPAGPVFDRAWRTSCVVAPINKNQIGSLINQHYLHEWPRDIQLAFGLKRRGKLIGVITYSTVTGETRQRFGPDTWELSRLVVIDRVPTNAESFFIARTIKYIQQHYPSLKRLVSFADPKHGHRGTVYRASNWTPAVHHSKSLFVFELRQRARRPPPRHPHRATERRLKGVRAEENDAEGARCTPRRRGITVPSCRQPQNRSRSRCLEY